MTCSGRSSFWCLNARLSTVLPWNVINFTVKFSFWCTWKIKWKLGKYFSPFLSDLFLQTCKASEDDMIFDSRAGCSFSRVCWIKFKVPIFLFHQNISIFGMKWFSIKILKVWRSSLIQIVLSDNFLTYWLKSKMIRYKLPLHCIAVCSTIKTKLVWCITEKRMSDCRLKLVCLRIYEIILLNFVFKPNFQDQSRFTKKLKRRFKKRKIFTKEICHY